MATIKNRLRQPLVINVEGKDAPAIHFLSKETKEVPEELLTQDEFKNHIESGNLVVTRLG